MTDLESEKSLAAMRAVDEVADGMVVGLGTGSTAAFAVRELGRRVAAGLRIHATATSLATENLARSVGLPLVDFAGLSRVDLTIDGADEIDGNLHAIKGGGGALMREKIVAAASTRMLAIVDSSKVVPRLGRFPLPIEALPFAAAWAERCVSELGARVQQRAKPNGAPFTTDQGNFVFDAAFGEISDAPALARTLDGIAGVLEHGLFISEIDAAYIGRGNEVEMRTRSTPPRA